MSVPTARRLPDRAKVARLYRRVGWGVAAGELPLLCAPGIAKVAKALLDPDGAGAPPAPVDPWVGLDLVADMEGEKRGDMANLLIAQYLRTLITSPRPLMERVAWFWHGHLVSSLREVREPELMARQMRLYRSAGLGPYMPLVRSVATDAAMLDYLDGRLSTKRKPNENFSREVLELMTIGIGNYTEADVQAGAKMLTGWVVGAAPDLAVEFRPERHDPTPQTYLGIGGATGVDGVVGAISTHPALPGFVAAKLTRELLGPNATARDISKATTVFRRSGLDTSKLVAHLVKELATGTDRGPMVLSPVRWLVMAMRATGSTFDVAKARTDLEASGQVPFDPPNVSGWPSGAAWFSTSATVARLNLAARIAEATPETSPARLAAAAGDWAALSIALGLPAAFPASTITVLSRATTWPDRLVLALTSPEFVLA